MTLHEIRDSFIVKCGRYDLVTEDGSDNGADFFIQSGSRFLDRHANLKNAALATVVVDVFEDGLVDLPRCWLVQDVFVYSEGCCPVPLFKTHSSHSFQCEVRGRPRFYQIFPRMLAGGFNKIPASSVKQSSSTFFYSADGYPDLTIEILPHPRTPINVEIVGRFYSELLEQDEDTNVWSLYYADTLIKAALYELEVFYRNSEGAQDWLTAINLDLLDAEQMEVMQDIVHKGVMGL